MQFGFPMGQLSRVAMGFPMKMQCERHPCSDTVSAVITSGPFFLDKRERTVMGHINIALLFWDRTGDQISVTK